MQNNQRVIVQPVYAQQTFSYFIGAPLRSNNYVAQQVQDNKDYKEYLEFKKWQAEKQNSQKVATSKSYLVKNCSKCHSGGEPAGGFLVSDKSDITAVQLSKILKWFTDKAKPPGEMKAVIDKIKAEKGLVGNLTSELLDRVK